MVEMGTSYLPLGGRSGLQRAPSPWFGRSCGFWPLRRRARASPLQRAKRMCHWLFMLTNGQIYHETQQAKKQQTAYPVRTDYTAHIQ